MKIIGNYKKNHKDFLRISKFPMVGEYITLRDHKYIVIELCDIDSSLLLNKPLETDISYGDNIERTFNIHDPFIYIKEYE